MLTFVINGEAHQVTAEQFRTLVDVGVRIIRDASRDAAVEFTIGALHASAPTIVWEPQAVDASTDVDEVLVQVAHSIDAGVAMLEQDDGIPEWMAGATASALYQAASWFGETAVDSISFRTNGRPRKITRRTYRTLDRVLHEESDAIGSVTGTLMTATLRKGAHVTVQDEIHGRGVECYVGRRALRDAGELLGERVTVVGRIRRDHIGRPNRVSNARVEAAPEVHRVSVAAMGGALQGGPDSVEWLRDQRGD